MSQRSCNECAGRSRTECFLTLSLFSLCPAPKLKVAENSLAWEVIVGAVFAQPGPDHPDPNSHPSVGVGMVSAVARPGGGPGCYQDPLKEELSVQLFTRHRTRRRCGPGTGRL